MAITDWPEAERPREKLIHKGAAHLSDAELLAIFLRTGIAGKNAVELARELLTHFGSLTKLCMADLVTFSQQPGMGPAKYAQLQAVMEMARRALAEQIKQGAIMDSPQSVKDYLRLSMRSKPHEIFTVIFLDGQHRTIVTEELFRGTLTQASVYPREVVKRALFHNAAAVILAHNHPSGLAEPSKADEMLTQSLKQALALVDVRVLDHFVIGSEEVVSFAERGLI
ncbi:MAG: DNA repair protein RadC [Nitrosomonas sp.]|jgi:DNA repair protein RadC|nr:DNA repair protein RadC [Nitrosomonas sp.]MCC7136060.1 DNA repair protein RadC [Nitrosomonas sp.]